MHELSYFSGKGRVGSNPTLDTDNSIGSKMLNHIQQKTDSEKAADLVCNHAILVDQGKLDSFIR